MTQQSEAEDALKRILEMAFQGDGAGFFESVSSEAYVDLLRILPAFANTTPPETYAIEEYSLNGDDHRFRVRLQSPDLLVWANVTVNQAQGKWRIASIKVPGVRE